MTDYSELFNDYQAQTRRTAIYPRENFYQILGYVGLGLTSEAGEVAGKIKKIIRDHPEINTVWNLPDDIRKALKDELGDVLWYLARIADELMIDLSVVATDNLTKLLDRQERDVIGGSGDER